MTEENPLQVTLPVTELGNSNLQEPTTPITLEVVTPPVPQTELGDNPPKTNGEPNIIELLSKVDKGVLLKSEIIQGLLESARQQEKNKLYKTIDDKDNTINQLNDSITNLQSQLKNKEETTMEDEKLLLQQLQEMRERQDLLLKEMEKEKEDARLAKVQAYKASKVAEANGEIISALVVGSTEEEIDTSVEVAKAEYQKIVSPLKQQMEELGKPKKENAPKPSNPSTPPQMEFTAEQIKSMSQTEYAKYRESLLKSLKG